MGRAEPTACSLEEQRRLRASPNHYKSISFPFLGVVTGCFFFLPGCMGWSHVIVAGCCAPCGITLCLLLPASPRGRVPCCSVALPARCPCRGSSTLPEVTPLSHPGMGAGCWEAPSEVLLRLPGEVAELMPQGRAVDFPFLLCLTQASISTVVTSDGASNHGHSSSHTASVGPAC